MHGAGQTNAPDVPAGGQIGGGGQTTAPVAPVVPLGVVASGNGHGNGRQRIATPVARVALRRALR
jgi:hypothetical protein